MRIDPGAPGTASDAKLVIDKLIAWADKGKLDVLFDATGRDGASLAWKLKMTTFAVENRAWFRAAITNASPDYCEFIALMARVTGANLRTFSCEADALAWLATPLQPPTAARPRNQGA